MLHRVVLGEAPPQLVELFPVLGRVSEPEGLQRLRHWRPRHEKQVGTPVAYLDRPAAAFPFRLGGVLQLSAAEGRRQ